jgi:hypothetical protein
MIAIPVMVTSRCCDAQPTAAYACIKAQMMMHITTEAHAWRSSPCVSDGKTTLSLNGACNLLSISPAALYITYIVGISRARRYTKQKEIASSLGEARMPQLLSHIVRCASPNK